MTVKPTDFSWGVPVERVAGQMDLFEASLITEAEEETEAQEPSATVKTAGAVFTRSEQESIINEGEGVRASNLDRLDLAGTHYAPMDDIVRYNDDDPDFLW